MTKPSIDLPNIHAPIRIRLGKLIDVLLVSTPDQIQWLNQHADVQRKLDPSASWLHRIAARRFHDDLAFEGKSLPVFLSREDTERADRQNKLHQHLEDLRGLPGEERDQMADFVSGKATPEDIGVVVQQWCGRLFAAHYRSAKEICDAGRLLAKWPSTLPWHAFKERQSGRLAAAKAMIADAADGDIHCIHATSIGSHNLTRTIEKLRAAAHAHGTQKLSPDEVLRACLTVPPAVLRGCTKTIEAPFTSPALTNRTLIVFLVASAYAKSGDLDDAFLGNAWSACPARDVIPEMLRAVWYAAHRDETKDETLLRKINTWSRLIKAVS